MRVSARWRPASSAQLVLPVHYNHAIQAMLYASLDEELATELHDTGYQTEKRRFRLFVFSRLFGTFRRQGEQLCYQGAVTLHVASPVGEIVENLARTWLRRGVVSLCEHELTVEEVRVEPPPSVGTEMQVQALSPITVYSTVTTPTGKKTYYYAPSEAEFSDQCSMNLRRKYALVRGEEAPPEWTVQITPLGVRMANQVIVRYKGTIIKGWMGRYRLSGPAELLALALEAGLGAKNSQGFGMLQLVEGPRA